MSTFEKSICISNIYYLVKEKGLKIGDIEEAAGVSPGYISRLNKEENKTVPGIEFLLSVSEALNVSLEGLLKCVYTTLSPDERKVVNFLTKLLSDSNSYKILWEKQPRNQLYAVDCDCDGYYATHPLMETNSNNEAYFSSKFHADSNSMIQECYEAWLNNSSKLFLIFVNYLNNEGEETSGFELYMQLQRRCIPICFAVKGKESPFWTLLVSLLSAAKNSSSHVHLDEDAKKVIDFYLDPTGMEEFERLLSEDEVPF